MKKNNKVENEKHEEKKKQRKEREGENKKNKKYLYPQFKCLNFLFALF